MDTAPAQASSPGAPTEKLAGQVERVTFLDEENGFPVLPFKARESERRAAPALVEAAGRL